MIRFKGGLAGIAAAAIVATWAIAAGQASALTAPVSAGPPHPTKILNLDSNAFYPSATRIHVGDSINFAVNGFHTITFLSGQKAPGLIIPEPKSLISGKLDAGGSAFWFNGQPNLIINPVAAAPAGGNEYNGTGYLSSGLPEGEGPPKPFVVKFTKAGSFTFNCLVHPGMKGTVKVLAKGPVPSVHQDKARAKAQEAKMIAQALKLRSPHLNGKTVMAGNDGSGSVTWLRFFPRKLRIKAGTTVEFKIASQREVHTITIGPRPFLEGIAKSFIAPLPGEGPPTLVTNPLASYPSDPPPLPDFTGTNHGNGFEGTGTLSNAGPPLPSSMKIKFTKPGTYEFACMIHPEMQGKIVVTK